MAIGISRKFRLALVSASALVALTLGAVTPASAAVMLLTIKGRVQSGTDSVGLFGLGDNLTGKKYTIQFTYDTSAPGSRYSNIDTGVYTASSLYGRFAGSAVINIEGRTLSIAGSRVSDFAQIAEGSYSRDRGYVSHETSFASGNTGLNYLEMDWTGTNMFRIANLEMPNSYVALPTDKIGIYFSSLEYSGGGGGLTNRARVTFSYRGYLSSGLKSDLFEAETARDDLPSVTLTRFIASPIPEPSSWALMLSGFGLVGAAMRRRVAKVAYA